MKRVLRVLGSNGGMDVAKVRKMSDGAEGPNSKKRPSAATRRREQCASACSAAALQKRTNRDFKAPACPKCKSADKVSANGSCEQGRLFKCMGCKTPISKKFGFKFLVRVED